jgi:hypothetical protein
MRVLGGFGAVAVLATVIALGAGPSASVASADTCGETSCGVPKCWYNQVRLRPDMTRRVRLSCYGVTAAKLAAPPAHVDITNLETPDTYSVTFDARPRPGAPRTDEATFDLTGHEGSAQERVAIEIIPREENNPPICDADQVKQRSDGTGPVDVYPYVYCYDRDGDEFTVEGGGPGSHGQAPKSIAAGDTNSMWHYRTATFSGTETTTVWAVDSLGARSQDEPLEVTVGPGVDRLPDCTASSWGMLGPTGVAHRPGLPRRFGIICRDADGDPFEISQTAFPERGALALFDVQPAPSGYREYERWIDVAYAPAHTTTEEDTFEFKAAGDRGERTAHFRMVPRPPPENSGAGCGGWGGEIRVSTPGTLRLSCSDDEGDVITAEVVTPPKHGTVGPPLTTPGKFGWDDITFPYVPDPGYEGYDCVEVVVSDGYGTEMKITIDIWVRPNPPPVPAIDLPPLPSIPTIQLPPVGGPSARAVAQQVLGTGSVKRVLNEEGGEVWARTKVSRKELARTGHAPGLVVICTNRCQVRGSAELANGTKELRTSRRKSVARLMTRQPHQLGLSLGTAERKSLKRARKPQARFNVAIKTQGAKASSLKRTIAVGD